MGDGATALIAAATGLATTATSDTANWVVVVEPFGIDKALHVVANAALVVGLALRFRLGQWRAAGLALAAGVALELLHGTLTSLELYPPPPVGGRAELADVAADVVGIAVGVALLHHVGPDRIHQLLRQALHRVFRRPAAR